MLWVAQKAEHTISSIPSHAEGKRDLRTIPHWEHKEPDQPMSQQLPSLRSLCHTVKAMSILACGQSKSPPTPQIGINENLQGFRTQNQHPQR